MKNGFSAVLLLALFSGSVCATQAVEAKPGAMKEPFDTEPYVWDMTEEEASRKGKALAKKDAAAGRKRILTYGLPAEWASVYVAYLQDNYGVEVEPIAGCSVTPGLVGVAAGYNQVMIDKLESDYGKDILAEARQVAESAPRQPKDDSPSVTIFGEVKASQKVPYEKGLTLSDAIKAAGGLSQYADIHRIRVFQGGSPQVVDGEALRSGDDMIIEPGDVIWVPRKIL